MYYKTDYETDNISSFNKEQLDKQLENVLIFVNKKMIKTVKDVSINSFKSYFESFNPTSIHIHFWIDNYFEKATLDLTTS